MECNITINVIEDITDNGLNRVNLAFENNVTFTVRNLARLQPGEEGGWGLGDAGISGGKSSPRPNKPKFEFENAFETRIDSGGPGINSDPNSLLVLKSLDNKPINPEEFDIVFNTPGEFRLKNSDVRRVEEDGKKIFYEFPSHRKLELFDESFKDGHRESVAYLFYKPGTKTPYTKLETSEALRFHVDYVN